MDDDVLVEGLDRLVALAGRRGPSVADLQERVHRRRRHQRRVRRTLQLSVLLVVALVGAAAIAFARPNDPVRVTSDHTTTAPSPRPPGEAAFTIGSMPANLALQACSVSGSESDPTVPSSVECRLDNPATAQADGVRITRVIGGATPELVAAWKAGDAPSAATRSGGADSPADATFTTLGGTKVLNVTPGGAEPGPSAAAFRFLVGDDLVDVGASNVSAADLGQIVASTSVQPPSDAVAAALDAFPKGSEVLVHGPRSLWVQPDQLDPSKRSRFPGSSEGAVIALPGAAATIDLDVITEVDAGALLDELVAADVPGLEATEIGGHRAVVLGPDGMMPLTIPEPRAGPQLFVQLDARTLVRLSEVDGPEDRIRTIAERLHR